MSWLQLKSGVAYDLGSRVCPGMQWNDDVVHTLSRLPRFLEHTSDTWTDAAHAVACARLARALSMPLIVQYKALHHDDHEALIGDIPGPVKAWLERALDDADWALDELEDTAQAAIGAVLVAMGSPGISRGVEEDDSKVRYVDSVMLIAEARVLKVKPPRPWGPAEPNERDVEAARVLVRDALFRSDNYGARAAEAYVKTHWDLVQEMNLAK